MSSFDTKQALTVEDILGKDVYDVAGAHVGVSSNLYISEKRMHVLGLAVDKGFFSHGLIIGTAYFQRITSHAIFLSIRPAQRLKWKMVFDRNGALLGRVVHIDLKPDSNDIRAIHVRRLWKKHKIPAGKIARMDENVLLKVTRVK